MRAVIAVLRAAANLKQKYTTEKEDVLMLRAILDVNVPKFLDQDVPLFNGILSDLFPGVEIPPIDYDAFKSALTDNCKKMNLQPLDSFFVKITQLYEMIIVRHGLMVVGESFGMKTSAYKVLAAALGDLCDKGLMNEKKMAYYVLNPKSVTMGQLYGMEDPVSKEWSDGILAVCFRNAARDTRDIRKWIMLDGPVDAIWIENMNTVLDDNKKLCLNSGEIVAMSGLMNMIFEVQDLAVASPATVSRCGMVYVQESLLGWETPVQSCITTLPDGLTQEHRDHIMALCSWLIPPCLRVVSKMCKMPLTAQSTNLVCSFMRLYYPPEICVKVQLLNFMTTPEGLEDQLLGIVVAKERPDLEEEKNKLIVQGTENKRKLKEIEDEILKTLSASEGNILKDKKAVEILQEAKITSDDITEKQKIADVTEAKIDEARRAYKPVAFHSTCLFFCVADIASIDPMYQYSLAWFTALFIRSISDSPKSPDLSARLKSLADHFTYFLYVMVCRSLFEKDKLLFAFHLSTKLAIANGKLTDSQLRFLLTGGVVVGDLDKENPAPEWISPKMWTEMCLLSDIEGLKGLADHVSANPESWRAIYDSPEPQSLDLPEPWADSLDAFQQLMVLRTIRLDKVIPGITQYTEGSMGKKFVEPLPVALEPIYNVSDCCTPLLFILSPGSDPMTVLLKFADDRNMRIEVVSLGQGQGPVAKKWIDSGSKDGYWVVLQNCHLAKSFLPDLERICETQLVPGVHKDFRLWLTSYPSRIFPISILENCVKMTSEAPKGLRAGMLRTYTSDPVSDSEFFNSCSKDSAWRKMMFGLGFFHSVLQERRKFGAIGFNIGYQFNENDLRISVRQLKMFLDEYEEIPYETLKYTCGECNYGWKVTDGHDRNTLMALLDVYYTSDILNDKYKLSSSGNYAVPPQGSHKSYLDAIYAIPLITSPEVFGLHENATITKDLKETDEMLGSLMLTQSSRAAGGRTLRRASSRALRRTSAPAGRATSTSRPPRGNTCRTTTTA